MYMLCCDCCKTIFSEATTNCHSVRFTTPGEKERVTVYHELCPQCYTQLHDLYEAMVASNKKKEP